jgi:hypothetical protein
MEVRVETITWLSEAAQEAEVVVCSRSGKLLAFCQPCELSVGQVIAGPIHAFSSRNIQLEPQAAPSIQTTDGLRHSVVGTLTDRAQKLVQSCGFTIQIDDYLPGGIQAGDTVSFECGRLDIW